MVDSGPWRATGWKKWIKGASPSLGSVVSGPYQLVAAATGLEDSAVAGQWSANTPATDYGLRRWGTESKTQMDEDEAQRNRGVDPAAAASDLRAILAAGGEGQSVIAQCRALDQWAKRTRLFLAPTSVVAEARIGGTPHKRYFAGLGLPEDKIFTGYDAVDNEYFALRAEEIRAAQKQETGVSGQYQLIAAATCLPEGYLRFEDSAVGGQQ